LPIRVDAEQPAAVVAEAGAVGAGLGVEDPHRAGAVDCDALGRFSERPLGRVVEVGDLGPDAVFDAPERGPIAAASLTAVGDEVGRAGEDEDAEGRVADSAVTHQFPPFAPLNPETPQRS
jgi:hypothetical protein